MDQKRFDLPVSNSKDNKKKKGEKRKTAPVNSVPTDDKTKAAKTTED